MADAIYPGAFDPVHNGHVDIVSRSAKLFDKVTVAVYETPPKQMLFAPQERVNLFEQAVEHLGNVEVVSFSGLVPDLAHRMRVKFVVRGLRAGYDFETEFEMAHMWRSLDSDIEVVCMMSALEYQFVYSSRIKEVALLGGDIQGLVPKQVSAELRTRFK